MDGFLPGEFRLTRGLLGTNSGSTGGRYWFGEVFRGGPTDESFYVRDTDTASNVTDSIAWTIVE